MTKKNIQPLPTAQPDTCHNCGSATWLILTHNSFPTQLHTEPLTDRTELISKLHTLPTYNLHQTQPTFTIRRRYSVDLLAERKHPTLSRHKCDLHFSLEHPQYFAKRITYEFTEEAKF